ncbi:MAG: hypothetical protein LC797_06630 [Chloroflexi bacterium]|nr:hypothetical protein [Chloroflexota bacterium]
MDISAKGTRLPRERAGTGRARGLRKDPAKVHADVEGVQSATPRRNDYAEQDQA